MTRSLNDRLKRAYTARFGPEPEPPGRTMRDVWLDRLARLALFSIGLAYILGILLDWTF